MDNGLVGIIGQGLAGWVYTNGRREQERITDISLFLGSFCAVVLLKMANVAFASTVDGM